MSSPYANNMQLAPVRQPCQHIFTQDTRLQTSDTTADSSFRPFCGPAIFPSTLAKVCCFSFRFLITASSSIWTVFNLRTKTNEASIDNRLFPLHNLFSTLAKACCFLRRFVITDSTSVCAAFNLYVHRELRAETVVRAIATEIDFGIKTPPL